MLLRPRPNRYALLESRNRAIIGLPVHQGQGLRHVQACAGHKEVSATERYRENDLEALRLAVEKFRPLSATH